MDQSLALNALAPFLALAKSATSLRAAADLITQATSAPNTYVFAELLQQPNIQSLEGQEQYGSHYQLLKIFAWGTWEEYKGTEFLPQLSDAQALKLRLLSLLTIASFENASSSLSYAALSTRLNLSSTIDLEHLVTQAIYSNLLTATLNPAAQTVVITSVSSLRDLAPGSVGLMMAELSAWSTRCDDVLVDLEKEIAKVRADAAKRKREELRVEKQVKAVTESGERGAGNILGSSRGGNNTRGMLGSHQDEDEDDAMEVDGGVGSMGGRKRTGGGGRGGGGGGGAGGIGGFMGRFSGRSSGR